MAQDLLTKMRKLNWVLQQSSEAEFSFKDLSEILSDLMNSNVYIVSKKGKVLGVHYKIKADSSTIKDPETGIEKFPAEYNEGFLTIDETSVNLRGQDALKIFKYDFDTFEKFHTLIPIIGGEQRLGTLILTRYDNEYTLEDIILGEYGATVVGTEIQRKKNMEIEAETRKRAVVQMAIGTLSFSEIEAVQQIFMELGGMEGLLVASKVADRSGITRSVIVNALRKLESAGVIEARSLGMKGTHIRVINNKLMDELNRLDL